MRKFKLEFKIDSFGLNPELEIIKILKSITTGLEFGKEPDIIYDRNGKKIGTIKW